jgi:hypothetical protein
MLNRCHIQAVDGSKYKDWILRNVYGSSAHSLPEGKDSFRNPYTL